MAHVPGNFCWFECGTTDAAAAKRFYAAVFGWTIVDMPMPGGMEGSYTMLKRGDNDVGGLYELSEPMFAGVPSHWMTYVHVSDVEASVARARELGGQVVADAMDIPEVGRMAVLQDPTGATIALFEPGAHRGAAELGAVAGTFGWSELATRDTGAAKEFYTRLFDWSVKESQDGMPYTEWVVAGRSIGGMMPMTPMHGQAPPHWLPYVLVDDCDATMQKVAAAGGTTLVPGMDIPHVGRFGVFQDPTGAALAVVALVDEAR